MNDLYDPEVASTDGTEPGTQAYDALKGRAVLDELDGRTHDGHARAPVPNVLGMNFRALSVAQKLATGGYLTGLRPAEPGGCERARVRRAKRTPVPPGIFGR